MSQMDLGNGHTPAEVWQEIKHFLAQHPGVYRTRLQNKGMGARFGAELTADGHVQVTLQKGQHYKLPDNDFSALYPLYFRRELGEVVTAEAQAVSRYRVYFWGLIYWCHIRREMPPAEGGVEALQAQR